MNPRFVDPTIHQRHIADNRARCSHNQINELRENKILQKFFFFKNIPGTKT